MFQNCSFYFKKGIAIPMLKSKKIKAALMENKVFHQSIVGIFPKNDDDIFFLLALLNSSIVNDIIHNINPTVNKTFTTKIRFLSVPDFFIVFFISSLLFQ